MLEGGGEGGRERGKGEGERRKGKGERGKEKVERGKEKGGVEASEILVISSPIASFTPKLPTISTIVGMFSVLAGVFPFPSPSPHH